MKLMTTSLKYVVHFAELVNIIVKGAAESHLLVQDVLTAVGSGCRLGLFSVL